VSAEPWAWTFHYGRWAPTVAGWAWIPGTVWGPAWVDWYWGDGWVGWAPLGPVRGARERDQQASSSCTSAISARAVSPTSR
jgi:hypothetical protein